MAQIIRSAQMDEKPLVLKRQKAVPEEAAPLNHHDQSDQTVDEKQMSSSYDKPMAPSGKTDELAGNKPEKRIEESLEFHHLAMATESLKEENADLMAQLKLTEQELGELQERVSDELTREREEARKTGHEEGYQKGIEMARAEFAEKLAELDGCLSSLNENFDRSINGIEEMVIELTLASVTKLLGEKLSDEEFVVSLVKSILDRAREQASVKLHVSKRDFETIDRYREQLADHFKGDSLEIVPDSRVQLGGCLLQSAEGSLDGRLEIQLQLLKETILGTYHKE